MRHFSNWACLALVMLSAASASAAEIDPTIDQFIADKGPDATLSALVYLKQQADVPGLTARLDAQRAKLQTRHEAVVRLLQAHADASQPAFRDHLKALVREGRLVSFKPYWVANAFRVDGPPAEIKALAAHAEVGTIYFNYGIELDAPTQVGAGDGGAPLRAPTVGVQAVRAPEVWALGFTGTGILVATLDTGVDGNHPALASRWRGVADARYAGHPEWAWFDPVSNTTFPASFGAHGTHTMGTVCGGAPGQEVGVAPGAQWIHAAVIDRVDIPTTVADAIEAFQWMVDPDGNPATNWDVPHVCSNSWRVTTGHGYPPCDQTFWVWLDNSEAAGTVQLFSAGNEGPGPQTIGRPPDRATDAYRTCAVGAINADNPSWPVADFSSRGPSFCTPDGTEAKKPDVVAPGVNVYSSVPGGGYQNGWDGTSMASPHVNGVVALMREACPDLSVQEVKQILYETAVDLGAVGEDNNYGWGMVDAYEAVQIALSMCSGAPRARDVYRETPVDTPVTITLDATDYDGLPDPPGMLTFIVTALPGNGNTVADAGNGHVITAPDLPYALVANGRDVVFTPASGYYGTDTFTFKANDGGEPPDAGDSNEATVAVLVLYGPPVITTEALPLGRLNAFYGPVQLAAAEGQPPLAWMVLPENQYLETDLGSSQFLATGAPQDWHADDQAWSYALPFAFPFFGETYTTAFICSNGFINFGTSSSDWQNSDNGLLSAKRIAAMWDDLRTDTLSGSDIFIDAGVPGQVTVRWFASTYSGSNPCNFAITLFADGLIRFDYGSGNTGLTPTIGVSKGDGSAYKFSTYNNASSLTNANSHEFYMPATLPDGLALSATGELSGVPTESGLFEPTFRVTDALGRMHQKTIDLEINIGPIPPVAQSQNLVVAPGVSLPITLVATDDGLPDPPATVTYTLLSLPAHGKLYDANAELITAAPHVLGVQNVVEYAPNPYYVGADSFTFQASDGGTPPDGGDSNLATIATDAVATASLLYSFPLNSNPGWSTQGLWAFGQPAGLGSHARDPAAGRTGPYVYGYNLSGDYTNNMPRYHLTTTALDFRDTQAVQVKFWRWLGVEGALYDHAGVEASSNGSTWTSIWEHAGAALNEAAWSQHAYSLSPLADDQPQVFVRWAMGTSDAGVTYPGWNIDDIEFWGIAKPVIPGDLDCDGEVGFGDINPFVLALTDFAGWQALFPDCPLRNADIDGDGDTDFGDINPFVALLTQ